MRVFFKEGTSLIEITEQINRYRTDTYLMSLSTSDAIYIAADFPLNNFFVKTGPVTNTNESSIIIDYWSSQGWVPVVHKNDYTEAFSKSGYIEFTPDIDTAWQRENTNSSGQSIDGLENISVYGMYWIRLTVSSDLSDEVELEYIGHKFSDDFDLYSEFPVFNDPEFLTGFETAKQSWEEQHIRAADLIIQDLKRKGIILGAEQILDRSILSPASVSKVAELIYNAFGRDYKDNRDDARKEYNTRMDLSQFVVDTNNNAIKEIRDIESRQGWVSR
jgi:hypothetical protein